MQKKAELVAKGPRRPRHAAGDCRGPARIGRRISGSPEINKRSGTLAAQLERYREEREKYPHRPADDPRRPGPTGSARSAGQKLGEHFGDLDAEFTAKLQELDDKAVADLERQEKLEKEQAAIEALRPSLDAIRTLTEKLRQKPVARGRALPSLMGQQKKKVDRNSRRSRSHSAKLGLR